MKRLRFCVKKIIAEVIERIKIISLMHLFILQQYPSNSASLKANFQLLF